MDTSPTLATIRTEAAAFPAGPFLLTVGADNRPHCIPTTVDWAGESSYGLPPDGRTARPWATVM